MQIETRSDDQDRAVRRPSIVALRGRHLFVYDIVAVLVAIVGALALRFDARDVLAALTPYLPVVLLPLVVQPAANIVFGLYRREWRYASVREMLGIVAAVATGTVVGALIFLVLAALDAPGTAGMPRSFFALEGMIALILIGGGRFALRWLLESIGRGGGTDEEQGVARALVYGAGEAGAAVARMGGRDPRMRIKVVGFIDDDPAKHGSRLMGVRIHGGLEDIGHIAGRTQANRLVVAMPSAPGSSIRRAVESGRQLGLDVRIVPPLHEILGSADRVAHLRPVSLEDLLRREPMKADLEELAGYINGANVLVTGAGGSIGSELARQIIALGPRRLTVVDHSEVGLWQTDLSLRAHGRGSPPIESRLCDVRSATSIQRLIEDSQPDVIFHAAALKHVPMCEQQPAEAALTNVIGTRNLLIASERADVARFVLISTDKAVMPVSVMGATKRLAEQLTLETASRAGRPYIAVRFGNVLGSSGSVVPIFEQQLAKGLPLTITHPDATRYFMTIPEAVTLILQAAAEPAIGEVFILDMGEPVRIVDLAADMVRLSGLDPDAVDLVYTGLRPGERLHETLFFDHESVDRTSHERVWRTVTASRPAIAGSVTETTSQLETLALAADDRGVRDLLLSSGVMTYVEPGAALSS